jgi:hypothetical protein
MGCMEKYQYGDKLCAKGCKDYDVFEIINIVNDSCDIIYELKGIRWKQVYKISDKVIDSFYYKV